MRKIRKGWGVFDEFPPVFVRLLARERLLNINGKTSAVRVLSDEEISINTGFSIKKIELISSYSNWDLVSIMDAKSFCTGCNFDLFDWKVRNSAYALSANGSFAYLRSSSDWNAKYKPMLMSFFNAQAKKI